MLESDLPRNVWPELSALTECGSCGDTAWCAWCGGRVQMYLCEKDARAAIDAMREIGRMVNP